MNCFEFRRRLAADPNDRDIEFQRHVHECPACATYVRNQTPFERKLRSAMDVPVPDNLASRISLSQSMTVERARRIRHTGWFAIAAAVLATVGLATGVWMSERPDSIEQIVLNHMDDESQSLNEQQNVQLVRVNEILRPFGATVTNTLGRVDYLNICMIRKAAGAHLVVKHGKDAVTVLIMPGEYVHDRIPIQGKHFHGVIMPIPNDSMAVVTNKGESLTGIESRVRANVRFSF